LEGNVKRIFTPLACSLASLTLGFILGQSPRDKSILVLVALGLAIAGSGLALWKWWASEKTTNNRYWWQRVKRLPWTILIILFGTGAILLCIGLLDAKFWGKECCLNLGTELLGAVTTYILLDLVLGTRQRKELLIARMGSSVRDVAVSAVEELKQESWLTDGSLQGAYLYRANLNRAYLHRANLREAYLFHANLRKAELPWANLHRADLRMADLNGASLTGADLSKVDLSGADLREADLYKANLRRANLKEAQVNSGQLSQAETLEGATMPNGTKHD
jgi:hypothetical protein